ncbi:MAG: surface polysaccharide O-acyltransferase-like enzyme [Planctomycetota bacterium]|jgi:surface polysaccharide O-acyltransferase-like enzyme
MKPKLTSEDSRRLSALRFPLIVAVVFIHANNDRIGMPDPAGGSELWVHWMRRFVSEGLAATAVPLFFLISGYLFFAGWEFSRAAFVAKLRGRVRTLLVPYLLWNVALAAALAIASMLPQTKDLLSGKQGAFLDEGPLAWVSAIGGLTGPPVVYQFWFLRDLMVAVLLVPLWHAAHRFLPGLWVLVLGVLWFTHSWPLPLPSIVSLLFFFLGSWVASSGRSLFALDRAWPWLGGLYLILLTVEIVGGRSELHQLAILLGILSALGLSRRLADGTLGQTLRSLSASAFLVFAVHEPVLTIGRRIVAKLTGPASPMLDLALFAVLPIAVIVFACLLNGLLRRLTPRLAAVITGGR